MDTPPQALSKYLHPLLPGARFRGLPVSNMESKVARKTGKHSDEYVPSLHINVIWALRPAT